MVSIHADSTPPILPSRRCSLCSASPSRPRSRAHRTRQDLDHRSGPGLLQPSYNNLPGALEAGAPEFLDFLLAVSPAPRQFLYRNGLDHLAAQAQRLFKKDFAALTSAEADQILKPLIVPWTFDPRANPHQHFLTDLRSDLRAATTNSAPYAAAAVTASRRGRGRGEAGLYWIPIDPTRR